MNVNSQIPHVVVPTVNNTSREENVPINKMHTEDVQGSMPSIGTALVALGRTTLGTSNRPPKHWGPIVPQAIGIRMTDPETVPGILELDSSPRTGLKVVNALWMLKKFDLSIRRGRKGVLPEFLLPL
jgi:hypothetical protein